MDSMGLKMEQDNVSSVSEELLKLGFKQCTLDPPIFYLHKDDELKGIICCHVDDFLHSGGLYMQALS